jgi:HAD superfamily hydrolase (TIGR01509 family)
MKYAVIFDNDGTLIDSSTIHSSIESELFNKYGANISPKELELRFSGMNLEDIFNVINQEYELTCSCEKFLQEKIQRLQQSISSIKVNQGVFSLLQILDQKNVLYAIASGGRPEYMKKVLRATGLDKKISVTVSAWNVANGKPAPDVFLEAAKQLEVPPFTCIVVEDGRSGMIGAKNAGMKVIGIGKEHEEFADLIVNSFSDITIDTFETLAQSK